MAHLVADGRLERKKFNESYQSCKAHAMFGDCNEFIDNLERQISQILGD
ncbi:MAG: hypothetical protein J6Q61_06635 [Bacteroidales bacterium]|nr:hypothetical protein [Bacteroidales bacterium]